MGSLFFRLRGGGGARPCAIYGSQAARYCGAAFAHCCARDDSLSMSIEKRS